VEALLVCSIAAPLPGSTKHGLSPLFVHSVQYIIHKLSYQAKLALWTKELSAFENHVYLCVRVHACMCVVCAPAYMSHLCVL